MTTHHKWVAKPKRFFLRTVQAILVGTIFIMLALGFGMWGYAHYEGMSVVDAFANAAMILSGMGPLGTLSTNAGKIFAGIYALFSGLMFILIIGIIFAPTVHLFLHRINVGDDENNSS